MHTLITQLAQDNAGTFPEARNVRDLQESPKGLKFTVYDLLIKLYFRSNSLFITYLFMSFTGKTNIQTF